MRKESNIRQSLATVAVALLPLGVAACGGESKKSASSSGTGTSSSATTPTTKGGAKDACALLMPGEVAAAGVPGTKMTPGKATTGGTNCNFISSGAGLPKSVTVILNAAGGKSYFDQLKSMTKSPKAVPGLGDGAYEDAQTSPVQSTTIALYRGNTFLQVGGSLTPKNARALAAKALSRAP